MLAANMRKTTEEMFWAKVQKTETCWLWTGGKSPDGYGKFKAQQKTIRVHRYAYELLVGPIPEGLVLDHVRKRGCTSILCVNPAHLEPVTPRENSLRGDTVPARNIAKTYCLNGHPLTPENLRTGPFPLERGWRLCRICDRERRLTPEFKKRKAELHLKRLEANPELRERIRAQHMKSMAKRRAALEGAAGVVA